MENCELRQRILCFARTVLTQLPLTFSLKSLKIPPIPFLVVLGVSSSHSALTALQIRLAATANNVANSLTPGYKSRRVSMSESAAAPASGGVMAAVSTDFSQGPISLTGNPLDFASGGAGFFSVQLADGSQALTRSGSFRVSADGQVTTSSGLPVNGFPPVPAGTISVEVSQDGSGKYVTSEGEVAFTVDLARVQNPQGLRSLGEGLFAPTPDSGPVETGPASLPGNGPVIRSALELSNVNLVEQMVNLIEVKAAYTANLRAIQTADEMAASLDALFRKR
jgi:flagellar basal-body rod protein FlgG